MEQLRPMLRKSSSIQSLSSASVSQLVQTQKGDTVFNSSLSVYSHVAVSLARFAQGAKIAEETTCLTLGISLDLLKRRRVKRLSPRHHAWRTANTKNKDATL